RRAMEIQRPPVVAEPLPGPDRLRGGCGRERPDGRPALEPGEVARHDSRDLRLLEHHLRDEDCVRIPRTPPGQVPARPAMPGQERIPHWTDSRRLPTAPCFAILSSLRLRRLM